MSGLEDRLKQHYIYPYDPQYVDQMNSDDYDPHLNLAVKANAISEAVAEEYKSAEHKDAKIKAIRHVYKQGNYACQYGAGGPRVALTCGISKQEGEAIVEAYWKLNWSIRAAAEAQIVKVCNGSKWLYNPVSKFWYSLRHEKDRFSTLVQGTAVYCFDTWVGYIRESGLKMCGQMHDEIIAPIRIGKREKATRVITAAIEECNKTLGLDRQLDVDIQFGLTYSDIH
jgi:hypothetical protein